MTQPKPGSAEREQFAAALYREKIRPTLTDADIGKFVIIDTNSGEYEVDRDDLAASDRLNGRQPNAFGYIMRVGYSAAYFFGGYDAEPRL